MKRIGAIMVSLVLLLGCFCAFAEEDVATRNEEEEDPILIDGELLLKIRFDFRDEDDLVQYDVDVYLDGIFIATVPHGTLFKGTVMVSEGEHIIVFCKSGEDEVQDEYTFEMEGPMILSCEIKPVDNKVEWSDF